MYAFFREMVSFLFCGGGGVRFGGRRKKRLSFRV